MIIQGWPYQTAVTAVYLVAMSFLVLVKNKRQAKRFPAEHNLPVREKEKKYWNKQYFGMR